MAKKTLGVNPWTQIWVKPRLVIRKIVKFNPRHRFAILSFLYGVPMLLHAAQNLSVGEDYSTVGIVLVAAVLGTFIGMLSIVVGSLLLHWTGKWIGGKADFLSIRAAVSWSNAPNIFAVIIWGALIYLFSDQIFFSNFGETDLPSAQMGLISGATFIQAIIAIWSFIILIKGLGEVQGFSAWKGILNVLIPFFLIGILIWAVSWVLWVFGVDLPI